jgi:hypothetical protein
MSLPSHRCRIEGACKACGEEHRPGVQVCLVELVDTGLPEVLLVSVTWKRVERCRCRLCRAEDENGSAWDVCKRRGVAGGLNENVDMDPTSSRAEARLSGVGPALN